MKSEPLRAAQIGSLVPFVEEIGALVSLLVWLAFGAVAIARPFESLTWQIVVYAVLSLTVIRMWRHPAHPGPRTARLSLPGGHAAPAPARRFGPSDAWLIAVAPPLGACEFAPDLDVRAVACHCDGSVGVAFTTCPLPVGGTESAAVPDADVPGPLAAAADIPSRGRCSSLGVR
jgi:hypothetical protein